MPTTPAKPRSLFAVTATAHRNCSTCAAFGLRARSIARATGSVGATHSDGTHSATVERVTR